MGFILWIIGLAATAIGYLLSRLFISLGIIGADEIIAAVFWFLICYVTFMAGKRVKEEGWYKLLSLNFFLTWAFCTIGVIVGEIVWILIDTSNVSVNLDQMITVFFGSLPLTIGPTASMSLGLRD